MSGTQGQAGEESRWQGRGLVTLHSNDAVVILLKLLIMTDATPNANEI
jgi:hypothetical protein